MAFRCNVCNSKFAIITELTEHIENLHAKELRENQSDTQVVKPHEKSTKRKIKQSRKKPISKQSKITEKIPQVGGKLFGSLSEVREDSISDTEIIKVGLFKSDVFQGEGTFESNSMKDRENFVKENFESLKDLSSSLESLERKNSQSYVFQEQISNFIVERTCLICDAELESSTKAIDHIKECHMDVISDMLVTS